jgi:DNA-binding NtrC family response regulator
MGVAHALRCSAVAMMTTPTAMAPPPLPRPIGYHGAVSDFKRRLIEATLYQMHGNRTHTARALGLQRTYLLRLIRELDVAAPPPASRRPRDHR